MQTVKLCLHSIH